MNLSNFVSNMIESNKAIKNEYDYLENDILYCGKCNTPKEMKIKHPFTDEIRTVGVMCECRKREIEAENKAMRDRELALELKRIKYASFSDSDYSRCTFDSDDGKQPDTLKQMINYAKHFQRFKDNGQGMILFGDVGTGKTFYSACIANALIDQGYKVMMTNFPSLISKIQKSAFDKDDEVAKLLKYDLMIIDDLGVERSTEYMQENVYAIIDARYRAKKPMIISTNLSADELRNPSDMMAARIYGRILERCLPIRFSGQDKRKHNTNYAEMRELLNG